MNRKQITMLFLTSLMPWIVGNAVMALVPIYARQLGADDAATGLYLAISFAALAVGSLGSGWLSRRFQRRKAFIVGAALLSVPMALLMSQAQTLVALTAATSILWLFFGIATTMVNILTGLSASAQRRGLIFGIVGASAALGRTLGGLIAGPIVDRWDFPTLLVFTAGIYAAMLVVALLLEEKQPAAAPAAIKPATASGIRARASADSVIPLLLIASTFTFFVSYLVVMTRPLAMQTHGFSASAISTVVAISGLVNLPLPFIMGWWSDRAGRRVALMVTYALPTLGAILLIPANLFWHFALAQALISVANISLPIGSALITDLVEPGRLSVTLARWSASMWIGAVAGFVGGGIVTQAFGLSMSFVVGAVMAALSVLLVVRTFPRRSPLFTQAMRRAAPGA